MCSRNATAGHQSSSESLLRRGVLDVTAAESKFDIVHRALNARWPVLDEPNS
jgi:hypothetical protein